jgi:hypothetical protein
VNNFAISRAGFSPNRISGFQHDHFPTCHGEPPGNGKPNDTSSDHNRFYCIHHPKTQLILLLKEISISILREPPIRISVFSKQIFWNLIKNLSQSKS